MVKENYLFTCDFDKIVNETYQLTSNQPSLQSTQSALTVIKLFLGDNHCYKVSYNQKSIEIPKNWGIFATMRSGDFRKLQDLDREFYAIFTDYFELSAEVFLGLNDEGLYFLLREIGDEKKAA